jgi:hypothetical protein
MLNLIVYQLEFTLEAQTPVHLGLQAGAQIRGALWTALKEFACSAPIRRTPEHRRHCPMCRLVALETSSERGIDPPRPFAIRPPLPDHEERFFRVGETFTVGINLYGDATELIGYVIQAVRSIGQIGVGYGRGRSIIRCIEAVNPFNNMRQTLYDGGDDVVHLPHQPILHDHIARAAARIDRHLRVGFLTPTQLTHAGHTLVQPTFSVLIARILERCQAMQTHYTTVPEDSEVWRERYLDLTAQAEVIAEEVHTRWVNVTSGSRRSNSRTSIGGFVGEALFTGDMTLFAYWLLWGEALHVGKNAVKGNGWFIIES